MVKNRTDEKNQAYKIVSIFKVQVYILYIGRMWMRVCDINCNVGSKKKKKF